MTDRILVVGVSGAGTSTLAQALAAALGLRLVKGDVLHPPANLTKMAAAIPLTDQDRVPFLKAVATALSVRGGVVASCSALKRSDRDLIRASAGAVCFVLPLVSRAGLEPLMRHRVGHFVPPALLDSQLATLEVPGSDEEAILVDGALDVGTQVADVLHRTGLTRPALS